MSFCMKCRAHATFHQTVFLGAAATTIKLCDDCVVGVGVDDHLANIKNAPDKDAKNAAVAAFLSALEAPAPGTPGDQLTA